MKPIIFDMSSERAFVMATVHSEDGTIFSLGELKRIRYLMCVPCGNDGNTKNGAQSSVAFGSFNGVEYSPVSGSVINGTVYIGADLYSHLKKCAEKVT